MKNSTALFCVVCLTVMSSSTVLAAGKTLTQAEATALFKGKTFDGYQEVKQKKFRVYSAPDGKHTIRFASGKEIHRFWKISDKGEHCIAKKKKKMGKCSKVMDMGNGVYHKVRGGTHTHTLKNFVAGNKL